MKKKKNSPTKDTNQLAKGIVDILTGEKKPKKSLKKIKKG